MATGRKIIVAGEITTTSRLHICQSVRTVLNRAGLKPRRCLIYVWVTKQSLDISAGVTTSLEAREGDTSTYADLGAGDQGTVYGYATDETRERLPLPLVVAHGICRRLDQLARPVLLKGSRQMAKRRGRSNTTIRACRFVYPRSLSPPNTPSPRI